MLTFANPFNVTDDGTLELDGARGIATAAIGGTTYLFVCGEFDDGISVFSVAANGTLTNVFNVTDAGALELDAAWRLTTAAIAGTTYVFAAGLIDGGVSVFSVAANGSLSNVAGGNVTDDGTLELSGAAGVATALSGGNPYVFVTGAVDDGVSVFAFGAGGTLTNVFNVTDDGTLHLDGAEDVATAVVAGTTYLFVAGRNNNGVSVFRVNPDGSLSNTANVADAGALELAGVESLATAVVGGTTYLFAAGSVDDGVSVFSVAANGTLTNVFNVTDDATLELDNAFDVATAVYGGTPYLYVGSVVDDGISVFSIAASGALTNVANVPDAGSLELNGVRGIAAATVGNTVYLFGAGLSDDGVSVLNQAAPKGQLWYVVGGAPADTSAGHVNNDGSNATLRLPTHSEGQAEIGIDLAAGYYFTASTDQLFIEAHRISDNVKVDELQIGDANGAGTLDNDLVRGLVVDPFNEFIYVGRWGETLAETGIVRVSYNPLTGDLDNNQAYNAAQTRIVDGTDPGNITHSRDMDLRTDGIAGGGNDFIYFVDNIAGYNTPPFSPTHGIKRFDLNNAAAGVTQLSSNANVVGGFPTDMSRGYIISLAVNAADSQIYFLTHTGSNNAATLWRLPIGGGIATAMTPPAGHPLAIGDIPSAGLTFDRVTEQLYITVQSNIPQGHLVDEVIQVQMAADGLSIASVLDAYDIDELVGHAADPNAHVAGTVYDQLPTFTKTDIGTAAVEQSSAVDTISSPSITDLDGDHLASARVQISGSFAGSGDLLFVLDGVTEKTSGTFTGVPGIAIAVTTDGDGNKTLTLTGYDTLANYQTVLNAVGFRSTGDNPTNYGANATRTVNWTVSDGAPNVPFGGQNTGITILNVTAVNDGPANTLPSAPSINEDVQTTITGISIADVDADPANQDISVALSVTHGTLNVLTNVANGILASDITGGAQDSNAITITAPRNLINATFAGSGLRYLSDLNYNGPDTLHIVTSDLGNTGTPGALGDTGDLAINVVPQNDTPDLTNVGATASSTEQIAALLDTDAAVADVDLDPLNGGNGLYTGASLVIARNGGANASDDFGFDTSGALFTVNGGDLQAGALTFATFTDVNGTLTIDFTSSGTAATSALVDDVIQHVTYRFATDNPLASADLLYTFNDGSPGNGQGGGPAAAADTGTITVDITPVNDAPVATITPTNYSATEQVDLSLKNNGLSVADVDANAGVEEATLSVTEGVLTVTAGASGATVLNSGTGSVTILGTIAQINALLNTDGTSTVVYNDNTDTPSATATLTLEINDDGNTGGGDLIGSDSATIDITAMNDAPVAVNDTASVAQNGTLSAPSVLANDTDPDNAILTAVLGTDAAHGALVLNSDGTFDYTPDGNFRGDDSFTYQASDGSELSNEATVTITVTPGDYLWSRASSGDVYAFAPGADRLRFDLADIAAADVDVASGSTILTNGVKTVTLSADLASITTTNVVFDDGSVLRVGDNTTDTVSDADPNTLTGGDGDDQLIGLGGADTLNGGPGSDTASYTTALAGVTAWFGKEIWNTGDAAGDTYTSMENLSGSNFRDLLVANNDVNVVTGGGGNDSLYGFDGDDTINGNAGDDYLYGGDGGDVLNGGEGHDYARYDTQLLVGVTVDLAAIIANTEDAAGDTFIDIESIVGSPFADKVYGDSDVNDLQGRGGNDELVGRESDDTLRGGDDNDTLDGGMGADVLDGGLGTDAASYGSAADGVFAALIGPSSNTGDAAGDFYISIDDLFGSIFRDTLVGHDGANEIQGLNGNDSLYGLGGDDVLKGGAGIDFLYGGPDGDELRGGDDNDFARYDLATLTGVTVDLAGGPGTGEALGDEFFDVESVVGSSMADSLSGDDGHNELQGRGDIDSLDGRAGNDTLDGGAGADTVTGGADNDTFVFTRGEAMGDSLADFDGQGAALGDRMLFSGYGNGSFIKLTPTVGQITSEDTLTTELITFANGAPVDGSDYVFV